MYLSVTPICSKMIMSGSYLDSPISRNMLGVDISAMSTLYRTDILTLKLSAQELLTVANRRPGTKVIAYLHRDGAGISNCGSRPETIYCSEIPNLVKMPS